MSIIDTGESGGVIFAFIWASDDPLSKHIAPRRYGRVDIDYGAELLAEGLIIGVAPACNSDGEEVDGAWELNISVGPPHAYALNAVIEAKGDLAVRVHS